MANYNPKTSHLKVSQWKKGQSGNPKGKPTGEHRSTVLKRLMSTKQDVKNPLTGKVEKLTIAEQMDIAIILKARSGDLNAYRIILEILEGKPKTAKPIQEFEKPIGIPLIDMK